jgi:hypothetical protein
MEAVNGITGSSKFINSYGNGITGSSKLKDWATQLRTAYRNYAQPKKQTGISLEQQCQLNTECFGGC